ncbi:MAG: helix-turn-helix domain-containing protein [Flavobacterium sp.]|nr:helix-turn-helix domain-containing protein [Flavobacterium sp.]
MVRILSENAEINKENLECTATRNYRLEKLTAVRASLEQSGYKVDSEIPIHKVKKSKEPKKSTVQLTYEMWQKEMSIKEIAAERKLTTQTICNHIAKLIQSNNIAISDVLPADKIANLQEAFDGYDADSLNGLKEKYGDEFTWNELKLYKASLTIA